MQRTLAVREHEHPPAIEERLPSQEADGARQLIDMALLADFPHQLGKVLGGVGASGPLVVTQRGKAVCCQGIGQQACAAV